MKAKKFLIAIFLILCMNITNAQNSDKSQIMKFSSELTESRADGKLGDMIQKIYPGGWPKHDKKKAACLRIHLENLSENDAQDLKFQHSGPIYEASDIKYISEQNTLYQFVSPTDKNTTVSIWFTDAKGNQSDHYTIRQQLNSEGIYDITLKGEKKSTINIHSLPSAMDVYLDNEYIGKTDLRKDDILHGRHTIQLSANGVIKKTDFVEVSESNTYFSYDLRERSSVYFTSDPNGALIYMDNEKDPIGTTPFEYNVLNGKRIFKARKDGYGTSEDKTFTIDGNNTKVHIDIKKKKSITLHAVRYKRPVNTRLTINGKEEGSGQSMYSVTLEYGTYEIVMTGNDNGNYVKGSQKITVSDNSKTDIEIEMKAEGGWHFKWPLIDNYDQAIGGLSVSYVRKQWEVTGSGLQQSFNHWGSENKWFNGVQFGFHLQPCFDWGLGLYSGVFGEYHYSIDQSVSHDGDYFDTWKEWYLNIPVQATFMIPFYKKGAIYFRAGLSMDIGLWSQWSISEFDYEEPITNLFNKEACPNRFNLSRDVGISIRFGSFMLHATYSKGLTNNRYIATIYDIDGVEADNAKQKKVEMGLSIVF